MSLPRFRTEHLEHLLAGVDERSIVGERLQWFLHFTRCRSVSETCQRFQIARTTFYRWARRFDPADLSTLEDLPTRPDLHSEPRTGNPWGEQTTARASGR